MPVHPIIIDEERFTLFLTGGYYNTNPASSLGGVFSSVKSTLNEIPSTLFDDVSYGERVTGSTKYRALCVKNEIYTDVENYTFFNVKVWVDGTNSTGEVIYISTASSGLQEGSYPGEWTMSTIATENVPPDESLTITWYSASETMSLGTLTTMSGRGIWVKRVVPPGASATQSSGVTIKVSADMIGGALVV